MEDKKQPIIVKRIKKGGHGHHGGAWKVAFADFAVAMMAFFMVMWLLGSVPTETLGGISDYFENVSLTEGQAAVPTQGMNGPGGASTSMIDMGGMMDIAKGEGDKINQKNKSDDESDADPDEEEKAAKAAMKAEQAEKQRLSELMKDMVDAIGKNKSLSPYKDQLVLQVTAEGLQIQIVDKEDRAMFASGGSKIQTHMREILYEIAGFLETVPNKISVSGHTDASPFTAREDYSNWELSADRANSARRALEEGGLPNNKVGRVEGLAASRLLTKEEPFSQTNRRISILVMNKKTEAAVLGVPNDPVDESLNPIQINSAPEQLAPLPTTEPLAEPLSQAPTEISAPALPQIPEPIIAPTPPPTEDVNVLNAKPIENNSGDEDDDEDVLINSPAGKISLPPIIDPNLLSTN